MRKVLIVLVAVAACASLLVAGCTPAGNTFDAAVTRFDSRLQKVNAAVSRYAPIIGRDVLMFGNILVTAECSPFMPLASGQVSKVLDIKAGSSTNAARVNSFLAGNMQVAEALCPLVEAIKTGVGQVPAAAPSQVIVTSQLAPAPVAPAPAVVPAAAK
jgi:hypothetical protein